MTTQHIPIDKIIPNPEQPRTVFDKDALFSLAQSIEVNGLIQPIVVEQAEDCYILRDGERRWRASQLIGHSTIEAVIRPPLNGTGPRDRLVQALVANAQREDLNPIEEAHAVGKMREMGMTLEQIAGWTGWSYAVVTGRLKLLELEPELQALVAAGKLPRDVRVTNALLSIPDAAARCKLGVRLARPGVSITAIVNACQRLKERLEAACQLQETRTPSLALVGKQPHPEQTARWQNIRAAAQGMCDACDVNPALPNAPEPAWTLIMESARAMCEACSLRRTALLNNLSICRECPGVELLKRMAANA